jgi:hypothetical protein
MVPKLWRIDGHILLGPTIIDVQEEFSRSPPMHVIPDVTAPILGIAATAHGAVSSRGSRPNEKMWHQIPRIRLCVVCAERCATHLIRQS